MRYGVIEGEHIGVFGDPATQVDGRIHTDGGKSIERFSGILVYLRIMYAIRSYYEVRTNLLIV